jgi:hypothetical protein
VPNRRKPLKTMVLRRKNLIEDPLIATRDAPWFCDETTLMVKKL